MKYGKFPVGYEYENAIIYQDRFLCFLNKRIVGKRYAVLYDPFEDLVFGHKCGFKLLPEQTVKSQEGYLTVFQRDNFICRINLAVGLDKQNPLLFNMMYVETMRDRADIPGYISDTVFFNPLTGLYLTIKNPPYLNTVESQHAYYYEKNFLAYVRENVINCDNFGNIIDVDINRQVNQIKSWEANQVAIIQPKISDSPKMLMVEFEPEHVYKHPTEPLLIVFNDKKYAIIDLDM